MPKLLSTVLSVQKNRIAKIILLIALISLAAIVAKPSVTSAFKAASASGVKRKLPIYSVETNEKKVALTFDAAWGASQVG